MNIGILTHPQETNYGGILQCYALSTFLTKMGHDTIVIRREPNKQFFLWEWIRALLRRLHFPRYYKPNVIDRGVQIRPFVERYINRTVPIRSNSDMRKVCTKYGLKAVLVGSDQVWRTSYAMRFGYNYFLDFVPKDVIRASYAASFGLSEWNYTKDQTNTIKKLLSRFKGISVREEDAITLIKDNTGLDAIQLVDPTMLLTQEDYNKITSPRLLSEQYVFVYWLGEKEKVLNDVEEYRKKGYKIIEVYLRDEKEQISVEDWLSYIKYADLVLTDSFHGCVFSLLFNTPFRVYQNLSGGMGRIASLFKQFDIKDDFSLDYSLVRSTMNRYSAVSKDFFFKVFYN